MREVSTFVRIASLVFLTIIQFALQAQPKEEAMDIRRIWDRGGHNAYTDINFFKGKLFVALREAKGDTPENAADYGKIRVLSSVDGEFWESAGIIELPGVDLREPKLIITPKKRMLVLIRGVKYNKKVVESMTSYTSISDPNGTKFSDPEPLELNAELTSKFNCLSQMTWYDKTGYGVLYQTNLDDEPGKSKAYLVKNEKKMEIEILKELEIDGNPTEATLRFLSGAEMMIIIKTGDHKGAMGTSKAPYTDWSWRELDMDLAGANFEVIPINKVILGTTAEGDDGEYSTLLLGKKTENFHEAMKIPSGGETGNMGMFTIAGYVWLSYHSSHEGKTSVYYARIPYSKLK